MCFGYAHGQAAIESRSARFVAQPSFKAFTWGTCFIIEQSGKPDIQDLFAPHERGQADKVLPYPVLKQKKNDDDPEKEPQHYFDIIF